MNFRQQPVSHAQRPTYPQAPSQAASGSPASSVFQSSSSLASLSTTNTASAVPQAARMATDSAPLPSPSANQPTGYFGSIATQVPSSYASQQQQRIPIQQQQQNTAPQYVGQRGDGGGAPETASFLQDFNLVAEAAKRAQVACLSRDLGDIGL